MKTYVYIGQRWFGGEWEGEYVPVKVFKKEEDAIDWVSSVSAGERTYVELEVE